MSDTLSPTPNTPIILGQMISSSNANLVKTATTDIILFDDQSTSVESMADLIFENIGGQELVNIARNDTINGQDISYQPIKNIKSLQQAYNPNNILGIQKTSDKYFAGFPISFDQKFPNNGSGLNGENIYVDELGNLVIEAIGLNNDEQIEVQLSTSGTIYIVQLDGNES
jgi:hypothetical protein